MPQRASVLTEETARTPEKLIAAALSAWEHGGAAAISARNLTAAAGAPPSSIHYHFGGLGQLLDAAQSTALLSAQDWCDAQWQAIGPGAQDPAMLGPLLATLIDEWCESQRTVAFAWREAQLAALRDPAQAAWATQWHALWASLFARLCGQMGLSDFTALTTWFFDGASALHLLRWRRPLDRAALEELCDGWAAWAVGCFAPRDAWFRLGQAEAGPLQIPVEQIDATAALIAAAAADTVADGGTEALTHRAVAARAGVTLGMVSYKYRTSADLLQAAFATIYRRILANALVSPDELGSLSAQAAITGLQQILPDRANLLGSDELMLASARSAEFRGFAAELRYLRGRSSGKVLRAMVGSGRSLSPIDGAIFSALLGGRSRACHTAGGCAPSTARKDDFRPLLVALKII